MLWVMVRITIVAVVVVVVRNVGDGGLFVRSVGQDHGDFRRSNSAPIDWRYIYCDIRKAQALRHGPQPVIGSTGREQRAQKHVTADAGDWVQNGKASVGHRLRI
jgi:hypothetical protein